MKKVTVINQFSTLLVLSDEKLLQNFELMAIDALERESFTLSFDEFSG